MRADTSSHLFAVNSGVSSNSYGNNLTYGLRRSFLILSIHVHIVSGEIVSHIDQKLRYLTLCHASYVYVNLFLVATKMLKKRNLVAEN